MDIKHNFNVWSKLVNSKRIGERKRMEELHQWLIENGWVSFTSNAPWDNRKQGNVWREPPRNYYLIHPVYIDDDGNPTNSRLGTSYATIYAHEAGFTWGQVNPRINGAYAGARQVECMAQESRFLSLEIGKARDKAIELGVDLRW